MRRILLLLLALLGATPTYPAQNSLVMPTTGPHSMADLTTNYFNPAFASILSNYSGSSAPAVGSGGAAVQYQWWLDTSVSPPVMRLYDGSSWVGLGELNTSNHTWRPYTFQPVSAQTTSYTITTADCGKLVSVNSASAVTIAIPQATGSFITCSFDVYNRGAGAVTLLPTTSSINGAASAVVLQNYGVRVVSDATNWLFGSPAPSTLVGGSPTVQVFSGVASVSDTTSLVTGCQDYKIVLENVVPNTTSVQMNFLVYANAAYQSTNYYSAGVVYYSSGSGSPVASTTSLKLTNADMSSTATLGGVSGEITMFGVSQTSSAKQMTWLGAYTQSNPLGAGVYAGGMWPTTGTPYAVTGWQLAPSSGTISGTTKVYCRN